MDNTIFYITAQLLGEKLQFVKVKPNKIVVVGSDYASSIGVLKSMYSAELTEIDVDQQRHLSQGKGNSWVSRLFRKNQNFHLLDFANPVLLNQGRHDFVVSNLYLARMGDKKKQIIDVYKNLLTPNGLLFFSCLGLDSFKEIYALFGQKIDKDLPLYQVDMHDIGDELIRAGFVDPVISMDLLVFTYCKADTLIQDLIRLGVLSSMLSWLNISYQHFENNLKNSIDSRVEIKFRVSYEFIFAHAIYKNRNNTDSGLLEQEIKFYQL